MRKTGSRSRLGSLIQVALTLMVGCGVCFAEAPSPYVVAWRTPSPGDAGSMPLGNGEISVNAWIEPSGALKFYIGRTDAWDDNGRLVKVGGLTIKTGCDASGVDFEQRLDVRSGVMTAQWGPAGNRASLALWVDANRPVVCVELETTLPSAPEAWIDCWRTNVAALPKGEVSDTTHGLKEPLVVEPDVILKSQERAIGWYHRNERSGAPAELARVQGMADFTRVDPLLHRVFGAWVTAGRAERVGDTVLRSARGTRHAFEVTVPALHPATAEAWLSLACASAAEAARVPLAERRAAHEAWWSAFSDRSWIELTPAKGGQGVQMASVIPANGFPVHIGMDRAGGNRFAGMFGRCSIYGARLSPAEIATLAKTQDPAERAGKACAYSGVPKAGEVLDQLAPLKFPDGFSFEAWIKPDALHSMRIVDQCTPGKDDGFLLDTHPGSTLRLINGERQASDGRKLVAGVWQHVAFTVDRLGQAYLYLNGQMKEPRVFDDDETLEDTYVVSRGYALQRYITACAGRGRYPIKFNGSIFTVSYPDGPGHADYRRWGPGYWWQNTRLPYLSLCTSGDTEMMLPLFRMYAVDLLPLFAARTRRWLGHGGAFFPECIYFWGDQFPETYGWEPFEKRVDKLQPSGWHKWEWVGSLELSALMLDYWEHTQDHGFLAKTALPAINEFLAFFDQRYALDEKGKYFMHPAQALETWWACTNSAPEVAGLQAVTERLLALPEKVGSPAEREFWRRVSGRVPQLPVTQSPEGKPMLAPAEHYALKRNSEVPELYSVFPFRRVAFDKAEAPLAVEALKHRKDRGPMGWRQDELFMAYLGQTEEAKEYLVRRARSKHAGSRFPAFWGPNYDWIPDQDHGGVLVRATQVLLMQTEGRRIWLRPAWPKEWNARFRLHAPYDTVVQGEIRDGEMIGLSVTPASRRADIVDMGQ